MILLWFIMIIYDRWCSAPLTQASYWCFTELKDDHIFIRTPNRPASGYHTTPQFISAQLAWGFRIAFRKPPHTTRSLLRARAHRSASLTADWGSNAHRNCTGQLSLGQFPLFFSSQTVIFSYQLDQAEKITYTVRVTKSYGEVNKQQTWILKSTILKYYMTT